MTARASSSWVRLKSRKRRKTSRARPSKIDTNFGTLEFQGGAYPTKATVDKVYEELDRQRATQLYLDLFPALSVHGILKGQVRDLGVRSSSDILVTPEEDELYAAVADR